MPPYRASLGGPFGSGMVLPASHAIDVSGAIEGLTSGASSLIHGAYLRRQATMERERQERLDTQHQANVDREYGLKERELANQEESQRRQDLTAGITRGKKTTQVTQGTPAQLPQVQGNASPIQTAMAPPGYQQTPSNAPAPQPNMPVPQGQLETTTAPDTYDPTKSAAYMAATVRGQVQKELADQRNATTLAARRLMGDYAIKVAKIRAEASKAGKVGKAMTGNAQETYFERVIAPGMLAEHNDNLQEAIDNLNNTKEGQDLKAQGFSTHHLSAAYEKKMEGRGTQAVRLQSGATGMTPDEATGAVTGTHKIVRGKGASSSGESATAEKPITISGGEPTDAEITAAIAAGQKKPNDVRRWVDAERKKGKKK